MKNKQAFAVIDCVVELNEHETRVFSDIPLIALRDKVVEIEQIEPNAIVSAIQQAMVTSVGQAGTAFTCWPRPGTSISLQDFIAVLHTGDRLPFSTPRLDDDTGYVVRDGDKPVYEYVRVVPKPEAPLNVDPGFDVHYGISTGRGQTATRTRKEYPWYDPQDHQNPEVPVRIRKFFSAVLKRNRCAVVVINGRIEYAGFQRNIDPLSRKGRKAFIRACWAARLPALDTDLNGVHKVTLNMAHRVKQMFEFHLPFELGQQLGWRFKRTGLSDKTDRLGVYVTTDGSIRVTGQTLAHMQDAIGHVKRFC